MRECILSIAATPELLETDPSHLKNISYETRISIMNESQTTDPLLAFQSAIQPIRHSQRAATGTPLDSLHHNNVI